MDKIMPLFSGCAVITTYRCNARCKMCHRWQHQSKIDEEFEPELILKLPHLHFINITGGEPFLRDDIMQIVEYACQRANRVVISTNGIMSERILSVMSAFPNVGIRISIEGLSKNNDEIRGIQSGYEHVMKTLEELSRMGCKDIGVSMTVSDSNYQDVIPLYHICKEQGYQFATGTTHNSFFFEADSNEIKQKKEVCASLQALANEMHKSLNLKDRYRAIFNEQLIKRVQDIPIDFPCKCGEHFFAISPYGDMMACLGSEQPNVMGNLKEKEFWAIYASKQAQIARRQVKNCTRNCCMSGNVAGEMKRKALKLMHHL